MISLTFIYDFFKELDSSIRSGIASVIIHHSAREVYLARCVRCHVDFVFLCHLQKCASLCPCDIRDRSLREVTNLKSTAHQFNIFVNCSLHGIGGKGCNDFPNVCVTEKRFRVLKKSHIVINLYAFSTNDTSIS